MIPVAVGKITKKLNPLFYCSYPETPPPSDEESSNDIIKKKTMHNFLFKLTYIYNFYST